jgi:hypothetical protein
LEWIAGGAYLSLEGDADLSTVLDLASQIHTVEVVATP